ncbi:hypothetical protein BP5796_04067 [Coleophoma crateriformis]|uniref:Uncharacterized protein n=1 Tax=Coleophoma crateriformis TaxID=565419 RepID=A0A3D8SHJ5_9HELO|nr:hypothetical protein BP5796_04067 [Coleophoma crateriformis]
MNRLSPPRQFLKAISQTPLPRLTLAFSTSARSASQSKLSNKRVLITGASRGIGKAIAYRFAAEGGQCVLVGRKREALEDVRKELSVKGLGAGVGHEVLVGDVASMEFWEGSKKPRASPTPNEVNSQLSRKLMVPLRQIGISRNRYPRQRGGDHTLFPARDDEAAVAGGGDTDESHGHAVWM